MSHVLQKLSQGFKPPPGWFSFLGRSMKIGGRKKKKVRSAPRKGFSHKATFLFSLLGTSPLNAWKTLPKAARYAKRLDHQMWKLCEWSNICESMKPYPQSSLLWNPVTITLLLLSGFSMVHSHSLSCGPDPLRKFNCPEMSVLVPPPSQSNMKQSSL